MRQYPTWLHNLQQALERAEQLQRELSAKAAAAGPQEGAYQDGIAADKLETELKSLAPGN